MLIQTDPLALQCESLVPPMTFDLEGLAIVHYWGLLLSPAEHNVQIGKLLDRIDA